MAVLIIPVIIAAGQSLSSAADLQAGTLLRIRMPQQWTPANITFQMSIDNVAGNFLDVWSLNGEIMIAVPTNRNVALVGDVVQFAREGFLKIRSGTSAFPVPQEAARTFDLVALK
jgi:hypothetical protein